MESFYQSVFRMPRAKLATVQYFANDKSSATRPTGRVDCNRDAMAGFAAAHGLAHLTFTQRSIRAVLPIKAGVLRNDKPVPATTQTLGDLLVACRKAAGLKQRELAQMSHIPRKWLGRWERNLAVPSREDLSKLSHILKLPGIASVAIKTAG